MSDSESLVDIVLDLADQDENLSDRAKYLVLAALEGPEALAQALEQDDYRPDTAVPRVTEEPRPVGAYLASIDVSGFRGIGPKAVLQLHPGPGLTIVAGRNGSGKSSFAEALELALTNESHHWSVRQPQWVGSWRNLHDSARSAIRVNLVEEGTGRRTIGVDWGQGAEFANRAVWTQREGGKQETGTGALGWRSALTLYRPILSYEELGSMLHARPTELHESLEKLLGLERLNEASKHLAAQFKRIQAPEAEAKAGKAGLRAHLAALEDERAQRAAQLLRKQRPDLAELGDIAVGSPADEQDTALLRSTSTATLPSRADVRSVADELRSAAMALAELGAEAVVLAERRTALLRDALAWHTEQGSGSCPVCQTGLLDEAWRVGAQARLAADDEQVATIDAARTRLQQARRSAHRLIASVSAATSVGDVELSSAPAVRAAVRYWPEESTGDLDCAERLRETFPTISAAFDALQAEAATALREREDAWAPLAHSLAAWLVAAAAGREHEQSTKDVHDASRWLKGNIEVLRQQRLAPLAEHARHIWSTLRQESNVDLGSISLQGQGNRRHVLLRAEVDGVDAGALGVMSQGELHALALALFLPRAARDESPLRFIVLDDPVQAMDPGKVEGFVRVLGELARDRQVVVFSHDDRLAEVVRRTSDNARIIEVTREAGSRVRPSPSLNPALRHVQDAATLAQDRHLPQHVQMRVLPGVCRIAVEAAARERFYRRQLTHGAHRTEVEQMWQANRTTRSRVLLALYGTPEATLDSWLDAARWRSTVLGICSSGVHQGLRGDPRNAVEALRKTVDDLLWST